MLSLACVLVLLACGRRLVQQIDQMEVFAMLFAKADIQLKLKELQREEERTGEKVLLGPPQIKLESFSRDDGDLDWMLDI